MTDPIVKTVADRLKAEVTQFGAVELLADLATLVKENALPQQDVSAFVVPLGFDDRGGRSASGIYTQMIATTIGVIVCVKSYGDAAGASKLPALDQLVSAVVDTLAGWAPDDVVGVFEVLRGRLLSVTSGLMIYQVEFALTDQLRIAR